MPSEDDLLLDVLAHPDDPAPRLVYADWLLDCDDPRADWIRKGCELLAHPAGSDQRQAGREAFRRELALRGHAWPEVDGLVLTWDNLVCVFRYRLAETIDWCRGRSLPLRADELRPSDSHPETPRDSGNVVQRLALQRSAALAEQGRAPRAFSQDLGGGRLLVYLPRNAPRPNEGHTRPSRRRRGRKARKSEVTGGAVEYLDDRLTPAWDTWLAFGQEPPADAPNGWAEGYLVSWVPGHLVGDVERRLGWKNPTGHRCLLWPEEFDVPFLGRLRQAGLTG